MKGADTMNILITGANGQLGNELTSMLSSGQAEIGPIPAVYRGSWVTAVDVDRLDITDSAAVQAFIEAEKPELIINCAAMTNVNGCESAPGHSHEDQRHSAKISGRRRPENRGQIGACVHRLCV